MLLLPRAGADKGREVEGSDQEYVNNSQKLIIDVFCDGEDGIKKKDTA